MLPITKVKRHSPFWKAGVRAGDSILAFDGYPYIDELDIEFYGTQCSFTVTIQDKKGNVRDCTVIKEPYEELGIEYPEQDLKVIPCKNHCVFCFVEQCKKGMRNSLYVKDDDYRLSFTCGSYVTLSNIKEEEIERIIRLKLSPLYISVHCYDKEVKKFLCKNPKSAELFDILNRLKEGGISFHTQIVMVEGINSGDVLKETVEELYKLYPAVKSIAVVPVGVTGHRDGLYPLKPVSRECANQTIDYIEGFARKVSHIGTNFVWCSDEMYVIAGRELPSCDYYEAFDQIENGVGGVSLFFDEAREALKEYNPKGRYTAITGVAFYPFLKEFCDSIKSKNLDIEVICIKNKWFGESITVAGLITATDIIEQTKGNIKNNKVIIPSTMLKEFEDVFLDGISVKELERSLDVKVLISDGGESFIKVMAGIK